MDKKYITFFHNSDYNWEETPSLFKPKLREENKLENLRPVFYWFDNGWFSIFPNWRNKYLYFFVKNPKVDDIAFRARHEGEDFNSLYKHLIETYRDREEKILKYCEPSILMSFSDTEPDLVIHFPDDKAKCGFVVKPETHKGMRICFFDNNNVPIKFTEIPEIVAIIPKILNSYPFIIPKKVKDKYEYEDWIQMATER